MYIGKAAERAGTTIKSIRHYEALGLLPPARRQGRYRLYDQASLDTLRLIKCAQQLGFRLRELQAILGEPHGGALPWQRVRQALADKQAELARQIAQLQQRQADLQTFAAQLGEAHATCPLETAPRS